MDAWAYVASVVYHDLYWYPRHSKAMMRQCLESEWGRLFQNWGNVEETPEGTVWNLRVRLGGQGSIRPGDWAHLIFGYDTTALGKLVIRRTELLVRQGGRVRTPLETL